MSLSISTPDTNPDQPLSLEAQQLECIKGDKLLFSGLSFSAYSGQVLIIRGENGSGKTSLLRILCGLALPEQGEIRWNGRRIDKSGSDYRRALCYIGHRHGIKSELTIAENLHIACGLGHCRDVAHIDEALEQIGLTDMGQRLAGTLSAGQHRRVALARLLMTRAPLWILDEPLTALDDKGRGLIEQLLQQHTGNNGMVIMTSHQPVNIVNTPVTTVELS
jgi:heme exporter protein A